ncbi:thioredoxin domain-containing protein [Anaeromyxobacter paludicola]|uniref:Tetratricopeptide repeat protein n=1 Tax=Anaeromyxobacter paludicola TaxID=2918171 RepID=A0ABM7XEI9_9BACT|nr:hypothetical protein [Anaeromyxobacter paludicola]BDG10300.1 hypothetical protein AMPC_34130 [Anaeromyxobacter paludicola]
MALLTLRDVRRAFMLSGLVVAALGWPFSSSAIAETGHVIDEVLPKLDGSGRAPVAKKGEVSLVFFFRPDQEHSKEALRQLARCEKDLAGRKLHWAAVVSDAYPAAEVAPMVAESGAEMPVLVDEGGKLYGKLNLRMTPELAIADKAGKVTAYQPFSKLDYCALVEARVRFALGEIDQAGLDKVVAPAKATMPGGSDNEAKRHVNYGKLMLGSKSWDKAIDHGRKAVEKDPKLVAGYLLLGDGLAGKGDCAEAAKVYDQALALDPKSEAAAKGKAGCGAAK